MKMVFEEICRTCLGSNSLNPIFKNIEHHERFSLDLANTTGIKVELNDGLPQNICIECMSQINSSLKFRAKCKDAETQLLQIYQETNTFEDSKETVLTDNQENVKSEYFDIKTEIYISDNDESMSELNKTTFSNLEGSFKNEDVSPSDNNESMSNLNETKFLDLEGFIKPNNITILENELIDVKKYKRKSKNKKETKLKASIKNEDCYKDEIQDSDAFFTAIDTNNTISEKTEELDLKVAKRVKCRICKKSLSVRSVDAHMNKRHPGSDDRKTKCEFCDKYIFKTKLNRHKSMIHGTEYSKCGYCKMEFSDKGLLIKHVASCAFKKRTRRLDTGKEMRECEVCHKKMQRASLKMHQRIQHAGLGPICDHCGRKFGNKLRLTEHLRARHGHDKYSCKHCPFRSASLQAMRNHERRHLGEKPYVCECCGARFHAGYLLTQHRQSHRTDKPAKCDLCPATFKANNSLHMHKAACHSNSTYKCMLCEKSYRCRTYALRHLRSVHGYNGLKSCEIEYTNVIKII